MEKLVLIAVAILIIPMVIAIIGMLATYSCYRDERYNSDGTLSYKNAINIVRSVKPHIWTYTQSQHHYIHNTDQGMKIWVANDIGFYRVYHNNMVYRIPYVLHFYLRLKIWNVRRYYNNKDHYELNANINYTYRDVEDDI